MKNFAHLVQSYYRQLSPPGNLPKGVEVMNPYRNKATFEMASEFYHKYYNDANERILCLGINPGRFGAGLTGIPFTDPVCLERDCGITNGLEKRTELSSKFIYEMIQAYGGPQAFYAHYYISGVSPLGYIKEGINLNYYDIKGYKEIFEEYVVSELKKQIGFGLSRKIAFSIGKGKNIQYLHWINKRHNLFDEIIPLPHPRWVMQYRLKRKEEFIQEYLQHFQMSI